jgi:hypothetical protein
MEADSSLLCSQEPATDPYPELHESSPPLQPSLLQFNFNNILPMK